MGLDKTKAAIHVDVFDRDWFTDMVLEFKQFKFDIDPPVLQMVQDFMKEATKNMIVYQLGKEESVPTGANEVTPRRTIVIALPIYVEQINASTPYIVATKLSRIYKPVGGTTSCDIFIKKEVRRCLETHIYSQLARTFHNCFYSVGEEADKILLDRTKYKDAHVVDAYEILEFHSSGYVWLKEDLRIMK